MESENSKDLMQHRQITLNDGRYMIFYTLNESLSPETKGAEKPEPKLETEATEEKNV